MQESNPVFIVLPWTENLAFSIIQNIISGIKHGRSKKGFSLSLHASPPSKGYKRCNF